MSSFRQSGLRRLTYRGSPRAEYVGRMRVSRSVVLALSLAATPAALHAECRPDTATAGRGGGTVWSHVSALHVDPAHAWTSFDGSGTQTGGIRVGIALCPWSGYTIAYTNMSYPLHHTTAYVARDSAGYHPELRTSMRGVEIQGRWLEHRRIHPLALVGAGWIESGYEYWRQDGPGIFDQLHIIEGKSGAAFADAAIGAEVTLFTYLRAYAVVGARHVGAMKTPALAETPFGRVFANVSVAIGKFR